MTCNTNITKTCVHVYASICQNPQGQSNSPIGANPLRYVNHSLERMSCLMSSRSTKEKDKHFVHFPDFFFFLSKVSLIFKWWLKLIKQWKTCFQTMKIHQPKWYFEIISFTHNAHISIMKIQWPKTDICTVSHQGYTCLFFKRPFNFTTKPWLPTRRLSRSILCSCLLVMGPLLRKYTLFF